MRIMTLTGTVYEGTPTEIVTAMNRASVFCRASDIIGYMQGFANRCRALRETAEVRDDDPAYMLVDAAQEGFIKLLPEGQDNVKPAELSVNAS